MVLSLIYIKASCLSPTITFNLLIIYLKEEACRKYLRLNQIFFFNLKFKPDFSKRYAEIYNLNQTCNSLLSNKNKDFLKSEDGSNCNVFFSHNSGLIGIYLIVSTHELIIISIKKLYQCDLTSFLLFVST